MSLILAIESSCDESSIAIIKNDKIIENITFSQYKKFANLGGVIPEKAARLHEQNLPIILDEIKNKLKIDFNDFDAFAITTSPGLIGCLQVGLQMAKTLAVLYNKPLIAVNHLIGHIFSIEIDQKIIYPSLALVISGGNTQLLLMKEEFDFTLLGETLDDAVGECFDKVARILGFPYPGGPKIEKLASKGKLDFKFPVSKLSDYNFSYSGLKSAVINKVHNLKQKKQKISKEAIAKSFQYAAFQQLKWQVKKALDEFKVNNLVVVGGVSINQNLQKMFQDLPAKVLFPKREYCPDNAAMIAMIASKMFKLKKTSDLKIDASSNKQIKF